MDNSGIKNKLWTKNFTIITLGTVVSMLGNAISGFAIGLMVLDYEQSVFLYALLLVVYNLPKIVMPLVAGPYLDNFSRSRVIYFLDFLSSGIYLGIFFLLRGGLFSYGPFLLIAFLIGTIDSVYQVAYESLYPTLISEGNYSKAYSISSMIYPVSAVMVPVAAFLYDRNGRDALQVLFLFNSVTFFVAALFETQIRAPEKYIKSGMERFSVRRFVHEFKDGLRYINGEKGLQIITAYFFVLMLATAASNTVLLPYFMSRPNFGVIWYTYVMAGAVIGQLVGGALQYRFNYPGSVKFLVSILVYIVISIAEGSLLFLPLIIMAVAKFFSGIMSVTAYNIRIASTQSYVPDEYRGRFNGSFQMICTLGTIAGQLLSGFLADYVSERLVLAVFMGVNLIAALAIMVPGQRQVKPIYNRNV